MLPEDAPLLPVLSSGRANGLIHVEAAVLDHLRAMRRPNECYSDVILRLIGLEASTKARR